MKYRPPPGRRHVRPPCPAVQVSAAKFPGRGHRWRAVDLERAAARQQAPQRTPRRGRATRPKACGWLSDAHARASRRVPHVASRNAQPLATSVTLNSRDLLRNRSAEEQARCFLSIHGEGSTPRTAAAQPERLAGAELNLLSIALRASPGCVIDGQACRMNTCRASLRTITICIFVLISD